MKVILTGSTGTVGGGVLRRCLAHPSITEVVALTRRPMEIKDAKLQNVIHKDFSKYDGDVIQQLKGAVACIWALGSPTSGKEVHVDYTQTAIKMLLQSVVPEEPTGRPFRFVYTSGGLVPYLDSNLLFFLGEIRKVRVRTRYSISAANSPDTQQGKLDQEVLDTETQNPGRWESFVARPWHVVDEPPRIRFLVSNSWIYKDELGAAMVDAALNGGGERIMDNAPMRERGQKAMETIEKGKL
ncbi:uncharacterized protein LTR77_001294 [Saxophila tyrrhenica]|uniref:NAD(P)-binding domain-containing protein n=1 Tax=Saxophila tyrrhenica TaxID=1690608 RepID=A0AAV9PPK2_9PEZI|nr:hypothetical protein LTR77_001294 [Saxophila tyrrhenica]